MTPTGAGVTSLWRSHTETGAPFSVKNRKIDRPGVRGLTAQNETGKCTGIGASVPVPFFFPEMNQSV
nr:MAG TPA: hypothetical protein [Caudoviricetes sp.]